MNDESTSVRMKKSTKKRIDAYGKRGESFDEIFNRMLDELGAS